MQKVTAWLAVLSVSSLLWGAELPAGATFDNSLGIKMVPIEAGRFHMGSMDGAWDESPVRHVQISRSFYLGATEVTNAQYERFDPSHRQWRGKLGYSRDDDEAVVFVSWEEAVAFCNWLSRKEGRPYRLPTEAEWEYACRAGTSTPYNTGDDLPKVFQKNVENSWFPSGRDDGKVVPLHVGRTVPNAWGLQDMHGNVEEWCLDWYGPYEAKDRIDPAGRAEGDFRVTRGGSHSTTLDYLRSANRSGTLPQDRSWLIGFRLACGETPSTKPLPAEQPRRWALNVRQDKADWSQGPDSKQPYFRGPVTYVKIPAGSNGPLYSEHNHCPALVACPNGDLLAIWYTCRNEPGRELGVAASRLRRGSDEWDDADLFWNAPDRNDHASALYLHHDGTIYHFNGLSAAGTWGSLATVMRTSTDNGATWSKARLVMPEHGLHHMPIESVFRTQEGNIVVPCDAVTGGSGGSAVLISTDDGKTWTDPGEGREPPRFAEGASGAWIAGIHAGVVQLKDGRLMALGRGDTIDGRMPMSLSADMGRTWMYCASPFPPISGGQRLVLTRLNEGPIFLASFARHMDFHDSSGGTFTGSGLFAALSYDEGRTWDIRRLITPAGPARSVDGGGNTGVFELSATSAEPRGYMSVHQTPDNVIHLISSKQYYAFNLAWLQQNPPPPSRAAEAKSARLENGELQVELEIDAHGWPFLSRIVRRDSREVVFSADGPDAEWHLLEEDEEVVPDSNVTDAHFGWVVSTDHLFYRARASRRTGPIEVVSHVDLARQGSVIRVYTELVNHGPRIRIESFPIWATEVKVPVQPEILCWDALSYVPRRLPLRPGMQVTLASKTYSSDRRESAGQVPFWMVTGEDQGLGLGLAWSGGWQAEITTSAGGWGLKASLPSEETQLDLASEEHVTGPALEIIPVIGDTEAKRRRQWLEERQGFACQRWNMPELRYPLIYNHWYSVRFNLSAEFIRNQVAAMEPYGFDALVVDAGWYPGVGDWTADPRKFKPGELEAALNKVDASRIDTGLWSCPWLRHVDSDEQTPEIDEPRYHNRFMDADSLDLAGTDFTEILDRHITDLERRFGMDWWKYDQEFLGQTPRHGRMRNITALQRALETVRRRHPVLTIESCMSGGRMINAFTDAIAQMHWIRDGSGSGYQHGRSNIEEALGAVQFLAPAKVERWTNRVDTLDVSDPELLKWYCRSCMIGTWGISTDLRRVTEVQRQVILREIEHYRALNELKSSLKYEIHYPRDGKSFVCAIFYDENGTAAGVLAFRWDTKAAIDESLVLGGVHQGETFAVTDVDHATTVRVSGAQLRDTGITIALVPGELSNIYFVRDASSDDVF